MLRDSRTYLWDALQASKRIEEFVEGCTKDDYLGTRMLSSAVERQFEIIGEALNKLARNDPETATQIPDLARIVAFRNILIHGYAGIDSSLVWSIVTEKLHGLITVLTELLGG